MTLPSRVRHFDGLVQLVVEVLASEITQSEEPIHSPCEEARTVTTPPGLNRHVTFTNPNPPAKEIRDVERYTTQPTVTT
jgi:hypothetical protein